MAVHRFRLADLEAAAWRNGGGTTREIVSLPVGAGFDSFDWRVSVATIAADGRFSVFPGVDRTIMLLEGDGVRLRSRSLLGAVDHTITEPLVPYRFSGEIPLDCTLIGGPSTDINLMVRPGRGSGSLTVRRRATTVTASAGLLLALGRDVEIGRDRSVERMPDGSGLWWDDPASFVIRSTASGAALVAVTWDRAG